MSFEIQLGPKARSIGRFAKMLLFASILCGLSSIQTQAAPLPVSKTAAIKVTTPKVVLVHKSIWAVKWATEHPTEEAEYLSRLSEAKHVNYIVPVRAANAKKPSVAAKTVKLALAFAKPLPLSTPVPQVTAAPEHSAAALSAASTAVSAGPAAFSGRVQQRRAAASAENTEGDVTLDFVAADINDVLKALAVQTHANIVSGTDVKGTITVSLSHVTLDQALEMITHLSGYEYAKVGSTYVIGTPAGILTLTGNAADNTPISSVVTFEYASFKDLSSVLASSFPNLKITDGSSTQGANEGNGSKALVLSGLPADVAQARTLITQIDGSLRETALEQSTVVYNVVYASPSDLVKTLKQLVPGVIVNLGPMRGYAQKAPTSESSGSGGGSGSGSGSSAGGAPASSAPIFNIGTAGSNTPAATPAADNSGSESSGLRSGGDDKKPSKSNVDPSLILLTGSPDDVSRAQKILSEIDVRPVQIQFDTKVSEIDINKVNNLGLNWNFTGATTTIGEESTSSSTTGGSSGSTAVLGNNGQTNLLSFGAIGRTAISNLATVTMDALITNGDAKLLADPNICAVDGQPAEVFIGNTINYVESITQTTTGENITTGTVQVGVTLDVTGVVGGDGYITLNIHPEVSEITGYLTVPGGGSLPQTANRYADTVVRVKDGETIAIGGLIQENDTKSISKVPGLGDLPILGKLFQDSQDNKTRTEIVFLLTTKIAN